MNTPSLELQLLPTIRDVDPAHWNALVGDGNPFVEHAWLAAMEQSGAVGDGTGWSPHVLAAVDADGRLVGAVPLYAKAHSFGEYVYDWAWADVAARIGAGYYPKLIAASPFSPVTGPRLMVHPDLDGERATLVFEALVSATLTIAQDNGIHGVHFLFLEPEVAERVGEMGLLIRQAHQYHWFNDGYASFDDFLARFKSKKRREIRRERRRLAERGYTVEAVEGPDLTVEQMDAVFRFYASTCEKYVWGRQYLDREFFRIVHETMPEHVVAMLARDGDGELVAGTFNLIKDDRIYGRYWGCDVDVPFLHFETCYYATIEYAIERGLEAMEPGAGGDHKYVRGFEPVTMYSAHWLADPRLSSVLSQATERECRVIDETIEHMREHSPLKK